MKKVLWISACAPYDKVAHAGGQNENFYVKGINSNDDIDLSLISFFGGKEINCVEQDLNKYGIKHYIIDSQSGLGKVTQKISEGHELLKAIRRFGGKALSVIRSFLGLFSKYAGLTNDGTFAKIKKVIDEHNFVPDVIVLEWTEIVLFAEELKKIFPSAKVVSIEEDVTFLRYERIWKSSKGLFGRTCAAIRYAILKKQELKCLKICDLVVNNNPKDEKLLHDNGVFNTIVISPFFHKIECKDAVVSQYKDIVFYGAMNRTENHKSVIWFIDNVFVHITDPEIRFVVVGNAPQKELLDRVNERICVTGFVESVVPYFENALCSVAPLVLGAGVKIKVLEGLSSGIPVLTNDIGIEGIPAVNGRDYLHCSTPEDYINAINMLVSSPEIRNDIGRNAKSFIESNYDLNKSLSQLIEIIKNI